VLLILSLGALLVGPRFELTLPIVGWAELKLALDGVLFGRLTIATGIRRFFSVKLFGVGRDVAGNAAGIEFAGRSNGHRRLQRS
jgi:hypothetical protein